MVLPESRVAGRKKVAMVGEKMEKKKKGVLPALLYSVSRRWLLYIIKPGNEIRIEEWLEQQGLWRGMAS